MEQCGPDNCRYINISIEREACYVHVHVFTLDNQKNMSINMQEFLFMGGGGGDLPFIVHWTTAHPPPPPPHTHTQTKKKIEGGKEQTP